MTRPTLSRRRLLGALGAGAASMPFLPSLLRAQPAAATTRLIVFFSPNEPITKSYWEPSGTGADRAIRIDATDDALDGDLVARALKALVEKEKPDLVLLGKQQVDGDANQVGQLLAEYLGCCENGQTFRGLPGDRGVGTLGGSQDHAAIVCSRAGFVEQYGFAPVRHERSIALAGDWTFAVGVSGVRASKTGDARHLYNQASRAASAALQAWRAASGREDATLFAAATWSPDARAWPTRSRGRR